MVFLLSQVGSNATFRLTGSDGSVDNITFAGADGLTVENTDANTITFRAPNISTQLYTDEKAQMLSLRCLPMAHIQTSHLHMMMLIIH